MPKVLITPPTLQHVHGPHVDLLREAGFEVCYPKQMPTTEAMVIEELHGTSAVLAGGEPYTEHVFSNLPELRVISRSGVGVDRIDLEAATRHEVVVAITPNANHEAVAEHTLAFLLALAKRVAKHNQEMREGVWSLTPTFSLRGKTLGLVGLGRIGRSVAQRALAFRLKIIACETRPDMNFVRNHGIELVDFDKLLSRADFVSLHTPLTPETAGVMNKRTLSMMKPGSFLINTARGGLIVDDDLIAALQSGHLAGAALDVFSQTPLPKEHPLLRWDNLLVSPHLSGTDQQSFRDMPADAARTIIDLSQGRWPEGAILNSAVREKWRW